MVSGEITGGLSPRKHLPGGTFFGRHNSGSINPILTKVGGQVDESQPETPCTFGVSRMFSPFTNFTNKMVHLEAKHL